MFSSFPVPKQHYLKSLSNKITLKDIEALAVWNWIVCSNHIFFPIMVPALVSWCAILDKAAVETQLAGDQEILLSHRQSKQSFAGHGPKESEV